MTEPAGSAARAERARELGAANRAERLRRHEIDLAAARQELKRLAMPLLGAALSIAYLIFASSCGFGQIGPETLIVAETPCGRIEYRSSKDQAAPGAVCRIGPDGAAYLEMGADASSGSGAVARAVAEGIVKGIGAIPK